MAAEHFTDQYLVKWSEKLHRPFVSADHRGLFETGHAQMRHLLYLPVEQHVVFVFLKDYLAQKTCIGNTLVDGELRQWSDNHAIAAFYRLGRVYQAVFGTDHRDALIFARFEAHKSGHLLADAAVAREVNVLRLDDAGLEQW